MKAWRQLKVGDHVHGTDGAGRVLCGRVAAVPVDWRDDSGSHASTTRGNFPKAWVHWTVNSRPLPWPVRDLAWPNHLPALECAAIGAAR